MSKKHRRKNAPARQMPHQQLTNNLPGDDALASTYRAFQEFFAGKTYLQENVAIQRPQVSRVEMAQLFRFGVTVHSAAVYWAEAFRQVRFKLADLNGNPITNGGPYAIALDRAFQNMQSVMERSEISRNFYGEILLQRLVNMAGMPVGFRWVNNNFFRRQTGYMSGLEGFYIQPTWNADLDTNTVFLRPEEVVYMHNVDLFDDFGGIGPAQVCFVQAATESEMGMTQLQFFRNMAMPAFALQPAAGEGYRPGVDQKNELTELLRRMYQGATNVGRSVVLPTRWESIRFQQDFDKLGMPDLTAEAKSAIVMVMGVPYELLDPRQSTRTAGTKFYDQRREWLISRMQPMAERYATEFTEQVTRPINPNWQIVPDYTLVRGLEEDVDSRTGTVQKQVSMAALDLYTAQQMLGVQPDENLRGIYLINGSPVPSAQFQDYWKTQPGNPGMVMGGELGKPDQTHVQPGQPKPPQREELPTSPQTSAAPEKTADPDVLPAKVTPFLGDEAYREWKNWQTVVSRKGADYAFTAKALPAHAVAYGRLLLATTGASDTAWNAIREQATKSYDDTENIYRADLYNLMIDAFKGSLDRKQFGEAGRREISTAFLNAFSNGLQDAGVDPVEMTDEERNAMLDETKMERTYWTALANDLYGNVLPLKDSDQFGPARDKMLARIELWVNKGLKRIYGVAKNYASMNKMQKWVYGGTVDHCKSCSAAVGQVHRARTWAKYLLPQSNQCECKGFKCECALQDTTDKASGSLAVIPVFWGAKGHEHDHGEDETNGDVLEAELVEVAL